MTQHNRQKSLDSKNFFSRLLGFSRQSDPIHEVNVPMIKPRKAPIKVEPKVFFANERTFLAWMHVSIILAGASIAILAFSDHADQNTAQIYGLITLPVAVIFIVYAMYQCKFDYFVQPNLAFDIPCLLVTNKTLPIPHFYDKDTRRAFMIRNKHPGPYEDTVGPAVLGIVLMLSITAQFAIKLNSIR